MGCGSPIGTVRYGHSGFLIHPSSALTDWRRSILRSQIHRRYEADFTLTPEWKDSDARATFARKMVDVWNSGTWNVQFDGGMFSALVPALWPARLCAC